MRFKVEIDVEINDHDSDLIDVFPKSIVDRYAGTAVKIMRVSTTKEKD